MVHGVGGWNDLWLGGVYVKSKIKYLGKRQLTSLLIQAQRWKGLSLSPWLPEQMFCPYFKKTDLQSGWSQKLGYPP